MAAHGLGLADLAKLAQGGGHKGDGDGDDDRHRIVGAWDQLDQFADGDGAVDDQKGGKERRR